MTNEIERGGNLTTQEPFHEVVPANRFERSRDLTIESCVDETISMGVLFTGYPGVANQLWSMRGTGFGCELSHLRMLDLPTPRHLFYDELAIHFHFDSGIGIDFVNCLQARYETGILGKVIGCGSDRLREFSKDGTLLHDHRSIAGGARIAP